MKRFLYSPLTLFTPVVAVLAAVESFLGSTPDGWGGFIFVMAVWAGLLVYGHKTRLIKYLPAHEKELDKREVR